jgi:hypothetical protein
MQGTQQRNAASAGRIAVLSRQLTNAGMAEVAQAAPEAYRLCAEAADAYAWLTRDNFELRQAIFKFLKASGTCGRSSRLDKWQRARGGSNAVKVA